MVDGLLGADLIGFHIQSHCNNFLHTVDRVVESRVDWEHFSVRRLDHLTLVAEAGVDLFGRIKISIDMPVVLNVRLDPRVLLFTMLASVASALLFGLAPALQSSHLDLVPALKSGKSDNGKRRRL